MRSPGRKVITWLAYAAISAGPNSMSEVRACCITTPSTSQRTSRSAACPTSSGVTTQGPAGVECWNILPCRNCEVRYCQSRIDTSLTTVYPAIAAAACSGVARYRVRPMTTPSSTSQSTRSLTDGSTRSSRAPSSVSANLANRVGYAGSSRPVSRMCAR
jgi:hypothetical protein